MTELGGEGYQPGVLARYRRLDQRRIGNRQRDALGRCIAFGTLHMDCDQLGNALAVLHDLHCQFAQEVAQRLGEAAEVETA